jgi:hypothetical protein
MKDILFVRTPVDAAPAITIILKNLARAGWYVVSYHEKDGEYSFVLEGSEGTIQ